MFGKNKEHRASPRLKYPKGFRPTVDIYGETFEVMDLSESGVKFKGTSGVHYDPHSWMPIVIHLISGVTIKIKARFVREVGDLKMLTFYDRVKHKYLVDEFEYLKKHQ